ncbi:MBL fold metallo-hydrolase [Spiractinospora alimapuensis]|uniref:MBL fold metallo-hydrolase n=1 Tax=Spiractinospora alimapuensis TaxID=2820884 RepID=UPI001F1AC0FA|nr:MBL fold metallo-hydrolase [Spiractinospora alimapuensis]QVQ52783.1 MBL fold metallo-hydrolase [Spiractinospora alimapuensis]
MNETTETQHPAPEPLEHRHPFRQWKTWTIPGTDLTLTGYSRANDKTFFHVPELRLALDAGQCEGRQVDTVLLTHAHQDHVKDLDFLASRPGTDIYLPSAVAPFADSYIEASARLNHGAGYDPELGGGHHLHGVDPDTEFTFGRRGGHHVRVVECVHKVPCVGYAVSEVSKALRPEFAELRRTMDAEGRGREFGRVIGQHRREGTPVDEETRRPLFAFLGDTHANVFAREPWLLTYPVVITECTFLYDTEKERADRVGHTVWSDLKPVIEAHPDTVFVLTHFSLRHSDREIVDFFAREARSADGAPLRNVVPWAHGTSLLPEQHQTGV